MIPPHLLERLGMLGVHRLVGITPAHLLVCRLFMFLFITIRVVGNVFSHVCLTLCVCMLVFVSVCLSVCLCLHLFKL